MQKKYSIRNFSYFSRLALLIFIFVALVMSEIIFMPEDPMWEEAEIFLLFFTYLYIIYHIYIFVVMPRFILINDDKSIRFISFTKDISLNVTELKKIYTVSMGYYVIFRFDKSHFKILNRIDGLYELISSLKDINHDIEIKGL